MINSKFKRNIIKQKERRLPKRDANGILINPTPAEILAEVEQIMKGPHHKVDPNKSRKERMKELGWL